MPYETQKGVRDSIVPKLNEGREQFLILAEDVRPDLHRYCARMTGSISDGEDVVQDTLAHAYHELSQLHELPAMRSWLFRIAHNRALDYLRSRRLRASEPLEAGEDASEAADPENALARQQAMGAAISRFLELAPAQRSCTILKDILDYSLEEIAVLLDLSLPAVKAALHRGRSRLRDLAKKPDKVGRPRSVSPTLNRYVTLFNARDWDAVRAMLIDDVKLDVVSKFKWTGRGQVGVYFTNYGKLHGWRLVPGWLDSRNVIAVFRDLKDMHPSYFIELALKDDRVAAIRDFRFVPYVAREAGITLLETD